MSPKTRLLRSPSVDTKDQIQDLVQYVADADHPIKEIDNLLGLIGEAINLLPGAADRLSALAAENKAWWDVQQDARWLSSELLMCWSAPMNLRRITAIEDAVSDIVPELPKADLFGELGVILEPLMVAK